jgi:hypothetical protein
LHRSLNVLRAAFAAPRLALAEQHIALGDAVDRAAPPTMAASVGMKSTIEKIA